MLIAHVLRDKGVSVFTLPSDVPLESAPREFPARKVGALVGLSETEEVVGVLSERDVVREVARRGAKALEDQVSAAMSRSVITAHGQETVDEGLARMTDRRVRHLPVVEDGRLVG